MIERPGNKNASSMMSDGMNGPDTSSGDNMGSDSQSGAVASIPLSLIGDQEVAKGDVIRLEVVSVDEQAGRVQVKYAHSKPEDTAGDTATDTAEDDQMDSESQAAKFD